MPTKTGIQGAEEDRLGDIIYDADIRLWYVVTGLPKFAGDAAEETPLAIMAESSRYWREVWRVLRIVRVPDDVTDELLDAITASARRTADATFVPEDGEAPSARYASYKEALAAAPEGWEPTVQGGWWTLRRKETDLPPSATYGSYEEALAAAPFGWEPTVQGGKWTLQRTEEPTQDILSLDEQIDQAIMAWDLDKVRELDALRDELEAPRGGLTRQQAAQLVFAADVAETPEMFRQWVDALVGPEPSQRPTGGEPQRLTSGPFKGFEASLFEPDLRWRDAQGNPIQSPFAAMLANQPFPGAPPGAGGEGTPGVGAFKPDLFRAALATPEQAMFLGQGPFTSALSVEDFEPLYAGASPEQQALIQAEFERRQRNTQSQGLFPAALPPSQVTPPQVINPLYDTSTPEGAAYWERMRTRGRRGGQGPSGQPLVTPESMAAGNIGVGSSSTPAPSVPRQVFARPLQAGAVLSPTTGVEETAAERAARLRDYYAQYPYGEGDPTRVATPPAPTLNPFEQTLFDIGQARRTKRKQEKFQRTPIPRTFFR